MSAAPSIATVPTGPTVSAQRPATDAFAPLTLHRRNAGRGRLRDEPALLGALVYGASSTDGRQPGAGTPADARADARADATAAVLAAVPATLLARADPASDDGAPTDAWSSAGPFHDGTAGALRWRHNGSWLFAALDLPETPGAGLESPAHAAYEQLFALLRKTGFAHIQRMWNYLPHINAEAAGMERYRQFNVGRQRAFSDDGRDVQHALPAACALGTHDDHLRVRVLAGRRAALPVENPRQVPAYRYPQSYGPRAPSFSRAALVDAGAGQVALLISGTASIVEHASVHPGDVAAQTRETLVNLQAVIDAAHARTSARFTLAGLDCTVYVRHAGHVAAVRAVLDGALGVDRCAQAVWLQADVCRSELLVEIEAQAFAPGRLLG